MKAKILVTAGNTWSPIDDVRVITNIFSGETGLRIAKELATRGFKVKLVLADCRISLKKFKHKNLTIVRAKGYKEFYKVVKREIKTKNYKAIVHAAAISDFQLTKRKTGKIKSGKKLILELSPTKKIVDRIKKWAPKTFLIKFKLESNKSRKQLMKIALKSKKQSKSDLVVANTLPFLKGHQFILIKNKNQSINIKNKKNLARLLTDIFEGELI